MTDILKAQDAPRSDGANSERAASSPDKISVFISSSMRDEGDFSWSDFRKEISDLLWYSDLFHPFAIEEHVSPLPSEQFYLAKVQQCDVLVTLIREELRVGTESEIRFAIEQEKPLVLITIGDNQDKATEALVHYIHSIDYATTHNCKSTIGLSRFILDQLNNTAVVLFKNRLLRANLGSMSSIAMGGMANHSVPRDAITAFGDSAALLARHYGYDVNWISTKCDNPYLEPLGKAAIQWLLDGVAFDLMPFLPTIKIAMSESGVPERTLELRLKALDAFISKDYKEAFLNARLAGESIAQKDSWLYGNCLIDERNMACCDPEEGMDTHFAVQDSITKLKTPVIFPLAAKYENAAAQQTLKTQRKYRTLSPRSTVYDGTLAGVLYDLCQLLFAAVLYGSIATFSYARNLVANALLDYSEVYSDEKLAYEGVRLLVLTGDAKEFTKHYQAGIDDLSNSLKVNADSLWHLSGKGIEENVPRMRCALVSVAAPYLTDDVFSEVEDYLISEPRRFGGCCQEWLGAIDSIKLRMNQTEPAKLLVEIIDKHLYISADKVGKIIAGSRLEGFPEDGLAQLAETMRERSAELIENSIHYYSFAAIEEAAGVVVLSQEQLGAANDVEKGLYLDRRKDDEATELACVEELLSQYRANNTAGRHVEFGYHPAPSICNALDTGNRTSVVQALEPVLDEVLETIGAYKGSLSSLDAPMAVLCKYACVLRERGKELDDKWVMRINLIPEKHSATSDTFFFSRYNIDTWKVRLRALRAAAGVDDGLSYLVEGVQFETFSHDAKLAYSESLAWLIGSGVLDDQYRVLAFKVCEAVAHASNHQVRMKAPDCYAAFSRRWGATGLENALFALAQDPSGSVVYKLLDKCKTGSLGDPALETKIIDLLSGDANWFIRWHAKHGE